MLELIVGRDSSGAPPLTLWIAVPAVAILVLALFARRRFPFAAPAAYSILAAAISFADLFLAFIGSLGLVGLLSAFLVGNLHDPLKAGVGLIIVAVGIVSVAYNIPGPQTVGYFVFIPLRLVVARVAGYALRERAEQAKAAGTCRPGRARARGGRTYGTTRGDLAERRPRARSRRCPRRAGSGRNSGAVSVTRTRHRAVPVEITTSGEFLASACTKR